MSRTAGQLKELLARGEGTLIGSIIAGDPDLTRSREYARALLAGGIALLQLGIPFSDPLAERSTVRAASGRALSSGTTLSAIFDLVKELRRETQSPIALVTHYNPVLASGEEAFLKRCSEAGVDGIFLRDLPVEEAVSFLAQARRYQVDTIFSVTPETDEERVRASAQATTGFLALLRYGMAEGPLRAQPEALVQRFRSLLPPELPLAVELEVPEATQVRSLLQAGAQGVLVESALIERIAAGISPEALKNFVQQLKANTRPETSWLTPS